MGTLELGVKRGRGRPVGSKDSGPRVFRANRIEDGKHGENISVEDQLRQMRQPTNVSVYSKISGTSAATLRKLIAQGEIVARSINGRIMIEPGDFAAYWRRVLVQRPLTKVNAHIASFRRVRPNGKPERRRQKDWVWDLKTGRTA